MKTVVSLIPALLLLAAGPLTAWPPLSERTHTKVAGDLVNIGVDFGDDASDASLGLLIRALKTFPHARRFRVSCSSSSLMSVTNLTVLYDRRRHSVTLYSTYSEGDNGGRTSLADHLRFTQVREEDFGRIAAAHKNDAQKQESVDADWFNDLSSYGCRKRDLDGRD